MGCPNRDKPTNKSWFFHSEPKCIMPILSRKEIIPLGSGRDAQEGGHICIHMADSRCCAAEAITTLLSNYTKKKKKIKERKKYTTNKILASVRKL